jgi:hypothetical protein
MGRTFRSGLDARVGAQVAMFLPSCSCRLLLKELEMPPAHISAALLAVALWAGPALATTVLAAEEPAARDAAVPGAQLRSPHPQPADDASKALEPAKALPANEDWRSTIAAAVRQAQALIEAGHARAPMLALALGAALVLPAVALASWLVHSLSRRRAAAAAIRAAQLRAASVEATTEMPASRSIPLWPHEAWLRLEGGEADSVPLAGQLIRIGRHQDNDIRLPDSSVHRYHAVIERTSDEAFVITDLSGNEGNGMRVNGERLESVRLSDGDVIELGQTRLRFERVPV